MGTAPQLEIKVIYGASSRNRRRPRTGFRGYVTRSTRWVALSVVNLLVATGLYYGTWWLADPELRVKLIMHTEFTGVNLNAVAAELIPAKPMSPGAQTPPAAVKAPIATPTVEGPTTLGFMFVATAIGWEFLSTVTICVVALSSGALLHKWGSRKLHIWCALLGVVALCALGWKIHGSWSDYGRFVPDQLRLGIGLLVVAAVLSGLLMGRRAKGLTYLAAFALIFSAGSTVLGLYIGAECDAIKPQHASAMFLVTVFVLHSLWGWILLPAASRL